jgi:hypothetical protein
MFMDELKPAAAYLTGGWTQTIGCCFVFLNKIMITVIIVAAPAKDPIIVPVDRILMVVQVSIILHNVAMRIFEMIKIVTLASENVVSIEIGKMTISLQVFFANVNNPYVKKTKMKIRARRSKQKMVCVQLNSIVC